MDEIYHKVRMAAYQEGDRIVMSFTTDNAQILLKYNDDGKNELSAIADNLQELMEYMWNDYMVRREFSNQLENELENWLNSE